MSTRELDNLVRIGQLKTEPRSPAEFKRMLDMARTRLADAQLGLVSREGRFTSAYNAAHAAAMNHSMLSTSRLPSDAAVRSNCLMVGLARGLSSFCAAAHEVPSARASSASVRPCSWRAARTAMAA